MSRVLVIDDETIVATILSYAFGTQGHETLVADGGQAGIDLARAERPDVIVLDLMMPTVNGLDVLDELRDDEATREVPILVLTAVSMAREHRECLSGGADMVMTKPFDPQDVAAAVETPPDARSGACGGPGRYAACMKPVSTTMRYGPRVVLVSLLVSALAIPAAASADDVARPERAAGLDDYRPDGLIKLCGLSTGCVINPLPNPTRGNNVYNNTGRSQKVAVRMEDGEGVRFWIALQNDGALADTVTVDGCSGTPRFVINAVLVGKHKRPSASATKITRAFKQGTADVRSGAGTAEQAPVDHAEHRGSYHRRGRHV